MKKIIRLPTFTPGARRFWESLPAGTREMLLGNVYCSGCRKMGGIEEYSAEMVGGGDMALRGKCPVCGGPVARLVEAPDPPASGRSRSLEPVPAERQGAGDRAPSFYLLRVALAESDPPVWRRFFVPASITLDRLHDVLQIVMGWEERHLHEFTIGGKRYAESPELLEDGVLEEGAFRLLDLVRRKGGSFGYLYDFGDGWEHEVQVENTRYEPEGMGYPLWCLEGEGASPPEDVGGLPGYDAFCRVMADPRHREHAEMREWYGERQGTAGGFDPAFLDLRRVNDDLMKYQSWTRDRPLPRGEWDAGM